jgi:hypothetical protein
MSTPPRDFIDASLFMGMHSQREATRLACKAFFVERLGVGAVMSLEHVGRCDDVVWQFTREVQDVYYPFMDNLHTDMRISRQPYQEEDLRTALSSKLLEGLPLFDRLMLAMVINRGGTLYSVSSRLVGRGDLPVRAPTTTAAAEAVFPGGLEKLYQASLQLRVAADAL